MTTQKKEKKRVPELRFPGFEGEWEEKRLDYLSEYIKSGRSKGSDDGVYNLYGSTGIIGKTNDNIEEGSYLLVARVGANAGQINLAEGEFGVSDNTLIISLKEGVSLQFISDFLIRYNINRLIYGSGQPLVTGTLLKNIKVYIPKSSEQQKIATFLTSIDTRIQQLEKKRTLLEQYKKGVMQRIFKQEVRFKRDDGEEFGEWEKRRLGDVAIKKSSNIAANKIEDNFGEYIIYGAPGILKRVDFYEEENDYISIVKDGAGVGRVLYCEGKSSVLATLDMIKPKKGLDTYFLYCLLENINFVKYVTGSTIPHIYFKDYKKEKIKVPTLSEQTKIAHFLTSLDKKIAVVDEQIEGTKEWKRGLLQRMFV